ncbi:Hypothetical predicted protein [Mytilus galloprovincialis]|uniref:Uncharacterized protein n=1 Tax=Mytilus galloprovincialis TaxID=29158 RepID=A0A8B6CPY7_MYTGA|nr:Hypothetical predicted protein [Mytilus galloprovincialis]
MNDPANRVDWTSAEEEDGGNDNNDDDKEEMKEDNDEDGFIWRTLKRPKVDIY